MKKVYQYVILSLVCTFLVLACTKEITDDLIVFFKVEFSETTSEAFLNTRKASQFIITSGGTINQGDYQIKYTITKGAGSYFLNDQLITENQFIDLPEGPEYSIGYEGTVVGINEALITIRDLSGREENFRLVYNVNDTDFVFDVVPSPDNTYIDGEIDLNLNITGLSTVTYDLRYVFGTPDSELLGTGDVLIDEVVAEPETDIEVSTGDFIWKFAGNTEGAVEIGFTVTSSLGISRTKTLLIEVGQTPDYSFTAILGSSDVIFTTDSAAAIDFTITESTGTSSYVMNYISSNTGNLTYNGEIFQPGDDISIQAGSSVGTYVGMEEGEHVLEFMVKNANTVPVSRVASLTLNYRDPDGTAPVIELIGASEIDINIGEDFMDPGAMATDDVDGDISENIVVTGVVDVETPGTYTIVYSIQDSSGNTSSVNRIVNVIDNVAPIITILGDNPLTVLVGDSFMDPGATANDNVDGNITAQIAVTGTVNVNVVGAYDLIYTVSDTAGNEVSETRTVQVISDNPPTITLVGANPFLVDFGTTFNDPGAMATDDIDGDISADIVVTGTVNVNMLGDYVLTYTVMDSSENTSQVTRTVRVEDNAAPVITLEGANPFIVNINEVFNDPGVSATDNVDGDLTSDVTITGNVDTNVIGDYVLTYSVGDSSGNMATITRTVRVIDNVAPVITLVGAANVTILQGAIYEDEGATAVDNVDGSLTADIVLTGTVNVNVPGTYIIRYNVTDSSGNAAIEVTRTVEVESNIAFDITTGVLTAPSGALVELSMSSGGDSSGTAEIRAADTSGTSLGFGLTCWGLGGGFQCLDVDGDGNDGTSGFTFTMPANGIANFTGSHSPEGVSSSNGTGFNIKVGGTIIFNGTMSATNGIPQ